MIQFIRRHRSMILNVFLVIALGRYAAVKVWDAWQEQRLDFVEVAFAAHNVVMLTVILVRRQHVSIDRSIFHQAIALAAFFSGIVFLKHPTGQLTLTRASQAIVAAALVLGTISLVNLGRSFGILISIRKVRTGGLYRVIRHPMYLTDILWRIGYLVGNLCWPNVLIFIGSSACYVYRALLEEQFLSQFPEYRDYRSKVRYRFIPGVF